ncbi:MAG: hypothetical protein KAH31_09900, partial [Candidatus Sabulitectum sp.]|nr:hypothetical protein [Candidatus Sabulitectum sp.]
YSLSFLSSRSEMIVCPSGLRERQSSVFPQGVSTDTAIGSLCRRKSDVLWQVVSWSGCHEISHLEALSQKRLPFY